MKSRLPTLIALTLLLSLGCIPGLIAAESSGLGPFGIGSCHTNNRSVKDYERWMPQIQSLGLQYYRSGATSWGQVEPAQGKFDWQHLDGQMDYLTQRGFTFGGILLGSPKWNTLDKPGTLPVNNIEAWSNYVTSIVQHTKGRIRHWEVWNEPPNFTGRDQTPADYAKIVVAAYKAAKAANPDCLVGLAAKSVHINYLEQTIKAGAKDHFDYITLHPYEVLDGIASNKGTEAIYMNIVPAVRKMLAAQNPEKVDAPVIFTELGCDVKRGADVQAHALVKAYTMGIAQGVACIQWFEGRDGDSGPLGLLDNQGTARPAYTALGQMIRHLGQHPKYLGWTLLNDKHYAFAFEGAQGPLLITWAYRAVDDMLTFEHLTSIVDPLTGSTTTTDKHSLTSAPVFILQPSSGLLAQAKANHSKPLPWGGDHTSAKSVTITFNDDGKQLEQGLHSLSGADLATAVVAYGGSARAGNVPGGNLFTIDPGFLSYTSEPIEITAIVRRNEANDNAGFKLVYESTNGFKTAKPGWYTVPDNQKWHTITWRIDDPQFVNYWGYNFALESDGNQFNKYYIQSITVTKTKAAGAP